MEKNEVMKVVEDLVRGNEKRIENLEKKIKEGGNKKSGESLICGVKKDLKILGIINKLLNEEKLNEKDLINIKRLGGLKSEWIEIDRENYLKEEGYLNNNFKVVNGKFYKKM